MGGLQSCPLMLSHGLEHVCLCAGFVCGTHKLQVFNKCLLVLLLRGTPIIQTVLLHLYLQQIRLRTSVIAATASLGEFVNTTVIASCVTYDSQKHHHLQEHYHVVDRHHVQVIMTDLIKAGRLQLCSQHPSLVCMGGVLRQLAGQGAVAMHLDPLNHDDDSSRLFSNDKALLC